jgi:hypothetical protein
MWCTWFVNLARTAYADAGDQGQTPPVTPATDIHGAPANTPGFGDGAGNASANPMGLGQGGGDGIHMIQEGSPGFDGDPNIGTLGGPSGGMHGGLDGNTGRGGANGNSGR